MKNFKVGDWVFCEFKLQQIKRIEKHNVKEVSDGHFSHSGYDLTNRCFHLDMKIKLYSDSVRYWSNQIHSTNNLNLNYPDINRYFIDLWVDLCENKDDDEIVKELYDKLEGFTRKIMNKSKDLKSEMVNGVHLFIR